MLGAMQELGGSQEKLLFWLHAKQGKVSFFYTVNCCCHTLRSSN